MYLAAGDATGEFLNYGLAGLIVVTFVIPMAIYIVRDKEKQLRSKDEEINRLRAESADLRRVLDPIAPALAEVGRVMSMAVNIISRGSGGGGGTL